jgi:hypothetical protein
VTGHTIAPLPERVQLVREAAGKERYERLELNALVQCVVVTDDRRGAAEKLTSLTQLTPDEILQSPYLLIGSVDQMVGDLQTRRERWDISYYVVHEPYIDDFAQVVARLAGK